VRSAIPPSADLPGIAALTTLSYGYARAIDSRDYDGLRWMFLPDVTITYNHPGGDHASVDSWLAGVRRLEDLDLTQHTFTNHEFEIDGDRARGQFNMMAQHVRRAAPGGDHLTIGGIYRDTYVRAGTGWLFATRFHEARWGVGNHAVLWGRYEQLG
jgi:SnoaL-like domain